MQVLEYKAKNKRTKETLLTCLADLFYRYHVAFYTTYIGTVGRYGTYSCWILSGTVTEVPVCTYQRYL